MEEEFFTIDEVAEKYNLSVLMLRARANDPNWQQFFGRKVMYSKRKNKKGGAEEILRKRIIMTPKQIQEYITYKPKRNITTRGWTHASTFCYKRNMSCQGCDFWERNCKIRAQECKMSEPPIKIKVVELLNDYGKPPAILLNAV